jgi:hypothetical protein
MKRFEILFVSAVPLLLLATCEKQDAAPAGVGPTSARIADDAAHDHEHDHAAPEDDHHDDAPTAGHDHAGEAHPLGSAAIGPYTVDVTQIGTARSGAAELAFEITVSGAATPSAVRAVVRTPDGAESLKVKADGIGAGRYHAHVGELPDALPAGSQVAVEVADAAGAKFSAALDLVPQQAAGPGD